MKGKIPKNPVVNTSDKDSKSNINDKKSSKNSLADEQQQVQSDSAKNTPLINTWIQKKNEEAALAERQREKIESHRNNKQQDSQRNRSTGQKNSQTQIA